jgi:demethylmenaquinone methyltransferase/2-methoxy-6-polyprenyl-1,4-benzoquinol methylase/phosphoethanolamine N-methyltransferase
MHSHSHEGPAQTEGRLIRWASLYDLTVNLMTFGHARRLRTLTVDQAQLKPGESVLDVGCGTGAVTIPAKMSVGKTGKAAGIDPAPEMIAVARQKAKRAGLEIDFRVGVIESLPFADNTFDAVTSSLMMHHLTDELRVKGLEEIWRTLKPGGSAFKKFFTAALLHHGHVVEFGLQDLQPLLKNAGFENVEKLDSGFLTIGFVRAVKPPRALLDR